MGECAKVGQGDKVLSRKFVRGTKNAIHPQIVEAKMPTLFPDRAFALFLRASAIRGYTD